MRDRVSKATIFGHMLVPFFTALYLILFPHDTPLMAETSQSYLGFSHLHSLGYPFFLNAIQIFSDNHQTIIFVQIFLFAFSLFFLSLSIRKASLSSFLAVLTVLSISLNPLTHTYHFTIQPHSLFLTFSLFMMAALISAFAGARFLNLFAFGLFMGLSIAVMELGWVYLVLIFIAFPIFIRQKFCSFGKSFLLPLVIVTLIVLLETVIYYGLHDHEKESPFATFLFAKSVLMDSQQNTPYAVKDPRTHIWNMIETDLEKDRATIWEQDDFTTKENLLIAMEETIRQSFAQKEFSFAETVLEKPIGEIQLDIASSRIIQDPMAFIEICIVHYQGLWQSGEKIAYLFWGVSIAIIVLSFWFLLSGTKFIAPFSAAFATALAVQGQSLWVAVTGLGPDNIIVFLSPFLTISFICVLIGFYISYINPVHTYD